MIHVVLPSKRKPKWLPKTYPSLVSSTTPAIPTEKKETVKTTELFGEFFNQVIRRNRLIELLLENCTFHVGDIVTPTDPEEQKDKGINCEIVEIYRNYTQYNMDWPEDNKPYVVKFKSLSTGKLFYCQPSYFKEHHEQVSSGV